MTYTIKNTKTGETKNVAADVFDNSQFYRNSKLWKVVSINKTAPAKTEKPVATKQIDLGADPGANQ